ncbi:Uma2 family endonuclease [Oxynema sp. CENA135]|uniref:Uma2 family endonuclease n=1 Tax=Oxynema sp. CENA135 TaxID=984206 RepID=UPI00190B5680|nr:Uma2 family endonuclease [Oxynema sp. CENA135]MBK4728905.1 Uma2 family endonuclease [Oxynema sp. CENA135]
MVIDVRSPKQEQIVYPDSDGQPMAENTKQFELIVWIKENLERLFADDEDVFIAGDLLWYPVEGSPTIRQAPDAMVIFGRPKGYRGSYKQWEEDNIAPQVVFEIWSPGNRPSDITRKFQFYDRHGVEEYYAYDPQTLDFMGFQRREGVLSPIDAIDGWVSPRLGIRFDLSQGELQIDRPDGDRFLTTLELDRLRQQAEERAQQAEERAKQSDERAQIAETELERERQRSRALEQRLRDMGIDPDRL